VKLFNTNQRRNLYVKTERWGTIKVAFDLDVLGGTYYRIFKTPSGRYIAYDDMDQPAPLKFMCSVKLPDDVSHLNWV
jgi:hypothetical protein